MGRRSRPAIARGRAQTEARPGRVRTALLALAVAASATGCGVTDLFGSGAAGGDEVPAGLAVYTDGALRAGYPEGWTAPAKNRRLIPGADFEVAGERTAGGLPQGTFAAIVQPEEQSVASLADHYMDVAKTRRDGKVLARKRIETGGREAHVLRQAYTASAGRTDLPVRQVDVYVRVSREEIADIRLVYPAAAYDAAQPQIDAVISAIRVTEGG